MTHTAMTAANVTDLATLAEAGDLDAIRQHVAGHRRTPAPTTAPARPDVDTAHHRAAARELVQCSTRSAAVLVASQLRGRDLAGVGALLGVTLQGTVAARRAQLVECTIGRVLTSGAISGAGSTAALAAWQDKMLARLAA